MATTSPTQRTLAKWRKMGYLAGVTERWNPHARIRQDLFGFVDVIAVGNGETVAIQTTSASNVAARVRKIEDDPGTVATLREANWRILVEGWYKNRDLRWVCREVDVS